MVKVFSEPIHRSIEGSAEQVCLRPISCYGNIRWVSLRQKVMELLSHYYCLFACISYHMYRKDHVIISNFIQCFMPEPLWVPEMKTFKKWLTSWFLLFVQWHCPNSTHYEDLCVLAQTPCSCIPVGNLFCCCNRHDNRLVCPANVILDSYIHCHDLLCINWFLNATASVLSEVSLTYGGWDKMAANVQMIFSNAFSSRKIWIVIKISLKFASNWHDWLQLISGSGNGLALNRRQAITWTHEWQWCPS